MFDEFFSGFRAKFQKRVTSFAFSIKFAKTNQKFAENYEFCENYSLFFKIIHWCPYEDLDAQRRESEVRPGGLRHEAHVPRLRRRDVVRHDRALVGVA